MMRTAAQRSCVLGDVRAGQRDAWEALGPFQTQSIPDKDERVDCETLEKPHPTLMHLLQWQSQRP